MFGCYTQPSCLVAAVKASTFQRLVDYVSPQLRDGVAPADIKLACLPGCRSSYRSLSSCSGYEMQVGAGQCSSGATGERVGCSYSRGSGNNRSQGRARARASAKHS